MLDIKLIESNTQYIVDNLKKRNFDSSFIEQILTLNIKRKELILKVETSRADIKKISKDVGDLKKNGQDATELMDKVNKIKISIEEDEKRLEEIQSDQNHMLSVIPNLVADDVPVGADEHGNVVVKQWGNPRTFDFKIADHTEIGEKLGQLDFEAGSKVTGARFAFLKGDLARMERALANFMLDFHLQNGYTEVNPPLLVHERSMFGTGQLPKFREDAFKLEGFDWYLIPTSEVPVTNIKRDSIFDAKEFPIKLTSWTPCFRSEAGSHGRDTKGLIRMHQFYKVEMVNITEPENSPKAHQEMIDAGCKLLELLGLPYRAMLLCSGDMGFGSTKTIDLEVWLPAQNCYREISSISNCGDFQSRRAGIRFKRTQNDKPEFAHTLNGSGLAVGRTLVAILENYQQADGSVMIPEKLRPYMGGLERIAPKL
jgi:seryl-tRNA synthetase